MLRSPASTPPITAVNGIPVMGTSIGANIRTITTSQTALSSDTTIIANAAGGACLHPDSWNHDRDPHTVMHV